MTAAKINRLSKRDQWKQALLNRAAQVIALALMRQQVTAEFVAHAEGVRCEFVASIMADPQSTLFCICVYEKNSGQFVGRSDEQALDALRVEESDHWFDHDLDLDETLATGR